MAKKKLGQDELMLRFALKVVGPAVAVFVAAIVIDTMHVAQWANAGPLDQAMQGISGLFGSIF